MRQLHLVRPGPGRCAHPSPVRSSTAGPRLRTKHSEHSTAAVALLYNKEVQANAPNKSTKTTVQTRLACHSICWGMARVPPTWDAPKQVTFQAPST